MRIYYASQSFYPYIGGVSTYLLNLCREMVHHGNEVVEVHLRPSNTDNFEEIKGIKVHRVPREPIDHEIMLGYSQFKEAVYKECHENKRLFQNPADQMPGFHEFNTVNEYFGEEIKTLLEQAQADIVHIHDFQLLFTYRYVPRGTPLILTWHIPFIKEMSPYLAEFLIKHMIEYDKVVFSAPSYIQAAIAAGLPKEKAELIHPIANTQQFKMLNSPKSDLLTKYKLPLNAKIILCVQRIDPKSGHEQLMRALPFIKQEVPNVKLVFVGSESLSNKLSSERALLAQQMKELVAELKLEQDIIWTGNIDYTDIPEIFNCADVVALCSKNEGFGLSVTEGMACGNPIVGTNVGGIPLQVQDEENGYLVSVGDIKNTADKIIAILKDEILQKRMSQKSLEIIDQKFKMEIGIEKHLILYNNLIKTKDEFHRIEYLDLSEIKGFITDLDRTLTNEPARAEFFPEDFKQSPFKELQSLGIDLFLCTGRSIHYVKKFCETFPFWRGAIAENGAVIYLPDTQKTITFNTIPMTQAKKIIRELNLPNTTVGKVIASNCIEDLAIIKEKLGKLASTIQFIQNVNEIMTVPQGVDKGLAIRLAMQYLNIDLEKTLVIGDGENDIDMFLNPGFKIAVANAHPKLKQLANQVTSKPSITGVKEIVEKLLRK